MSLTTSAWHKADELTEKRAQCEREADTPSINTSSNTLHLSYRCVSNSHNSGTGVF